MPVSSELKKKFISAVAVVATALGTFSVIGVLSGIWVFLYLAHTFAISPAPSPYDRLRAISSEDIGKKGDFGCEDKSGNVTWHMWDYLVRGEIPGPHRRGVTFLHYFSNLRTRRTKLQDNPQLLRSTKFYFCNDGPIAHAAGCAPDQAAVLFKSKDPSAGPNDFVRVECSL